MVDTPRLKSKISRNSLNGNVGILCLQGERQQYEEFREGVVANCQIWPGIELDILENEKRAHLIVICNPKKYLQFADAVSQLLASTNPNTFTTTIKETVNIFDGLDCIYVAHYFAKKPNLGDGEITLLTDSVANAKRILKEATNAISAGIYISHGHNSIYGSDIQNWDEYVSIAETLPIREAKESPRLTWTYYC